MKKLLSILLLVLCLSFGGLVACDAPKDDGGNDPAPTIYTVAFTVDGDRYATKRVNAGGTISGTVANPTKVGYDFDYWTLNGVEVDIYTYVVNSDITFVAHFTEITVEPEDDTNYFNVYIQVNGTNLTQAEAETFKTRFLETIGVSDADITRFHIEEGDATTFTGIINAATDVDVVIGGNNPLKNFSYNTEYTTLDGTNLSPNVASGHFNSTNRKIIIMANSNSMELAVRLFEFATTPYVINDINITITVHGDTDEITVLTDAETVITFPEFTVGDNELFKGFTTVENGSIAIVCAIDAELKYDDIKTLLETDATTLDLYPVIEEKPAVNPGLSVYVQVQGTNLTQDEAETLRDRFLATLTDEEKATVIFHIEQVSNAAGFTDIINAAEDIDVVIGGNTPLQNYPAHADGPLVNAGTGHFSNVSRKIIIHAQANDLELATKLYNFVKSDYVPAE